MTSADLGSIIKLAEERAADRERRRIRRVLVPLVRKLHGLCLDFDARDLDEVKHAVDRSTRRRRKP